MSTSKLESLPQELISHIATFVEALSVIHLSRTSKTIRSACWNKLTFKEILNSSQTRNWRGSNLDLQAIARRAEDDVSIWARYAVADDQAWVLAGMKDPLLSRRRSISFLPELAVVKHPFLSQSCWHAATHGPFDYLTNHVFSFTMAVLATDEVTLSKFHDPALCEYCYPKPRENDSGFAHGVGSLWAVCSVAINVRNAIKTRRLVWPYNESARVPDIAVPSARDIPLQPVDAAYTLPLPFTHRAEQLLNNWQPCSGNWDNWYRSHSRSLVSSSLETYFSGSWCGYYTHSSAYMPVDPPMTQIRINPCPSPDGSIMFRANNCVDGVGHFDISARVKVEDDGATMDARKHYHRGHDWHWDCRLTPFGIVGTWSYINMPDRGTILGYVWLWKEEWTRDAGEMSG